MFFTEFRDNNSIYTIILGYVVFSWGLAVHFSATDQFSLLIYSKHIVAATLLSVTLFVLYVVLRIMIVQRPEFLLKSMAHEIQHKWFTPQRIAQSVPMILCFMVFMATFSSVKSMIPVIFPYGFWDASFSEIDKILHFQMDPWLLLQPLLGHPLVTFLVNLLYNFWFLLMIFVLYWQAVSLERPGVRKQFFLSFFLCWIINGSILATMFSSVGPAYYGLLYGDAGNPYADQMAYLNLANETFPIWALETQNMLWRAYEQNALAFGSGISAMPSLHVSIAFLQVLLGYQISQTLGRLFLGFFFIIMAGSIHLGWHYAIDGYLSLLTTALIWWVSGRMVTREPKYYVQAHAQ